MRVAQTMAHGLVGFVCLLSWPRGWSCLWVWSCRTWSRGHWVIQVGGGVQLVACDGLDFSETGGSDNGIQGWQSMIFLAVLMTLCTAFLFSVAYLRTKHPGSTRAYCPLRRGRISGAACHAFMCGWQFADGDGNWTRTAYIAGASENQNAQSQKLQTNTDMRRNKNGTEEQWGRKYRWEDRKRVETQLQQIQLMKEGKQNWTNTHGMRNCQNKTGSDMHTETDMSSTLGQRIIRHGSTWQTEETKHRLDTKKGTGMKASNNQKLKLRGS